MSDPWSDQELFRRMSEWRGDPGVERFLAPHRAKRSTVPPLTAADIRAREQRRAAREEEERRRAEDLEFLHVPAGLGEEE